MNITSNTYPTPNFQARQIATAYLKGAPKKHAIKLYALHSEDKVFAEKMLNKLNLEKLYPNEHSYENFKPWKGIIDYAVASIGQKSVVLAVQDKRPCGIMAFEEHSDYLHLNFLAKWRTQPNKDTSFVGKALMHHLFDVAHEGLQWNIELVPSNFNPRGRDCKNFYSKLGFRQSAKNTMNLFAADYGQKAKELEKFFEYEKIQKSPDINALKTFNISFKQPLLDRIKNLFTNS